MQWIRYLIHLYLKDMFFIFLDLLHLLSILQQFLQYFRLK